MDGQMNVEELIESGVLELYVLGTLPEEEARHIHQQVMNDERLRQEVEAIEATLIQMGESHAPAKRLDVMDSVMNAIAIEEEAQIENQKVEEGKEGASIVSITSEATPPPKSMVPSWMLAAAVALILSLSGNIYFYMQWQSTDAQYTNLLSQSETFAQQNQTLQTKVDEQSDWIAHLSDPQGENVKLKSTVDGKSFEAWVKWNPQTQQISLYQWQLENLSEEQVYQLWAIIDGQPVSAGLLTDLASVPTLTQIEGKPAAFAITIEPTGGSEAPTLSQMVVMGNVTV
ncbi:MAG: anti-sigma factor [Bacteroidota bacterium]